MVTEVSPDHVTAQTPPLNMAVLSVQGRETRQDRAILTHVQVSTSVYLLQYHIYRQANADTMQIYTYCSTNITVFIIVVKQDSFQDKLFRLRVNYMHDNFKETIQCCRKGVSGKASFTRR